jgi:hypothetical protein
MRKWLLFGMCAIATAYPRCNDATAQHEYLETERWMFGVSSDVSPFESETLFPNRTVFMPSACNDGVGNLRFPPSLTRAWGSCAEGADERFAFKQPPCYGIPSVSNCEFIKQNTHLELFPPITRYTGLDKYATYATNFVWRMLGWQKQIADGEHYWYLENPHTNNIAFYLHGINGANGLENMYLLRQLAQNASVYFSVYSPVFYLDANYEYKHTYSEHIDNLNSFILSQTTSDGRYDIVGNSYGTIRTTTLCKRYPDTCERMTNIILTDPLNINLPYSRIFPSILYGVFYPHPDTPKYRQSMTIQTLRLSKYYMGLWNYMDWYEWSIDSPMIRRFADKIVLVIGLRDRHIVLNRDSPVLKLSRVIYTDTRHGMCVFSDFVGNLRFPYLDASRPYAP